jgi:hypothetical protein
MEIPAKGMTCRSQMAAAVREVANHPARSIAVVQAAVVGYFESHTITGFGTSPPPRCRFLRPMVLPRGEVPRRQVLDVRHVHRPGRHRPPSPVAAMRRQLERTRARACIGQQYGGRRGREDGCVPPHAYTTHSLCARGGRQFSN